MTATHPSLTPEYWEQLAKNERAFAEHAKRDRTRSVESYRIYIRDAESYERRAAELRAQMAESARTVCESGCSAPVATQPPAPPLCAECARRML